MPGVERPELTFPHFLGTTNLADFAMPTDELYATSWDFRGTVLGVKTKWKRDSLFNLHRHIHTGQKLASIFPFLTDLLYTWHIYSKYKLN